MTFLWFTDEFSEISLALHCYALLGDIPKGTSLFFGGPLKDILDVLVPSGDFLFCCLTKGFSFPEQVMVCFLRGDCQGIARLGSFLDSNFLCF